MIVFLAIIILLYITWDEKTTKPIPKGNMDNQKLIDEDINKIRFGEMSRKQFKQNLYNGKYRTDGKIPLEIQAMMADEKRQDKCINAMRKQWEFFTEEQKQMIEDFLRC